MARTASSYANVVAAQRYARAARLNAARRRVKAAGIAAAERELASTASYFVPVNTSSSHSSQSAFTHQGSPGSGHDTRHTAASVFRRRGRKLPARQHANYAAHAVAERAAVDALLELSRQPPLRRSGRARRSARRD